MNTLKRKTRSDKFPLALHSTGQYCIKVKGKIYYFGHDKKDALQRYLDQACLTSAKMAQIGHKIIYGFNGANVLAENQRLD